MNSIIKDNRVIYIGIGLFLWFDIGGISQLIEKIIFSLFLFLNVQPIIILWSGTLIKIIIFSIGFIIGLNAIKESRKSDLIIFRNIVILYILIICLQSLIGFIGIDLFETENYINNLARFNEYSKVNSIQLTITYALSFVTVVIPGIIIYKKR